jgi:hypothetical protein
MYLGEWPDWSIPAFLAYRQDLAPEYFPTPPLVAGEVGFNVFGTCVNRDFIGYLERIKLLADTGILDRLRRLERPRILEIGGGYGGLAYFLTRILPKASYVLVDLPSSLMHSGCYLGVAQATHPVRLSDGAARDPADGIELVVNSAAGNLGDRRFDLAINTASFAEMPAPVVRGYGALIRDTLADDGVLFEQNINIGAFGRDNFCSPELVLAALFPHCRPLPGSLVWGNARLWSGHPF